MNLGHPLISVCICTYRRPSLLEGLLEVIFTQIEFPGPTEIVVVDNDGLGSAKNVVKKFVNRKPILRHFLVPTQNISLARNKAVAEARGEWIAMIDDDERPDPSWLVCLFHCAKTMNADAVFGPVQPIYPSAAPQWIVDGKFFERPRYRSGTAMSPGDTRTGNVLLRSDVIRGIPEPFDPAFGLSGGEDSLLFGSLLAQGKRLFWCDDAVVGEYISKNRLTCKWLLKRSFRTGQTFARTSLNLFSSNTSKKFSKLIFVLRSIFLFLGAIVILLVSIPFGKTRCLKWLRVASTQVGKLSSFFFFPYQEYEDKPRTPQKPSFSEMEDE